MFSQTGRTNGKWTAVSFTLRDKYAPVVGASRQRRGYNSVHPYRAVHVKVAIAVTSSRNVCIAKFLELLQQYKYRKKYNFKKKMYEKVQL